jgi:hypothetical protein
VPERPGFGLDPVAQLLQASAQHLVVVAPARVARDAGAKRIVLLVLQRGRVVHAAADDAHRARHELCGARAERAMARHIIHLAVPALAEPLAEPVFRGGEVGIRDPHRLEPEFPAPLLDLRSERAVVHGPRV